MHRRNHWEGQNQLARRRKEKDAMCSVHHKCKFYPPSPRHRPFSWIQGSFVNLMLVGCPNRSRGFTERLRTEPLFKRSNLPFIIPHQASKGHVTHWGSVAGGLAHASSG